MALGLDKIKRDFARHKKKAGILMALALVMLVFIVKAIVDMSPRTAAANVPSMAPSAAAEIAGAAPASEEHVRQSKELWKTLGDSRGLDSSSAFTFDTAAGYYNLNPNHKAAPVAEHTEAVNLTPKLPVSNAEAERTARRNAFLAATRSLIVRSTVVGSGISRPVAVINDSNTSRGDRVLGVGDQIKGFEITAIRAREVEFKKDGITLAVKMSDDVRSK